MTEDTKYTEIQASHRAAADPTKTETVITGGEPVKKNDAPDMRLDVKTEALSEDPTKTVVTVSTPEDPLKIKVIGPFNGEVEVDKGSILKEALRKLNTEDNTFGRFKYRDEHGEPVSIHSIVEAAMTLTSLPKS